MSRQSISTRSILMVMMAAAVMAASLCSTAPAQEPPRTIDDNLLITLQADSTPVITVLEILAERSNLNIVTSPEVQGIPISIRLRNTPFEEALNLVVRAAGMGYERVGNSILVAAPQRLATQTGLATRVFELEYADAVEMKDALEVVSKDMTAYAAGNELVVKAPQSVLEEIDILVGFLDRKPRQVRLEARLLEVNTTEAEAYGIDWEKITNWTTVLSEVVPEPSGVDELPEEMPFIRAGDRPPVYRQAEALEIALDALITDGAARLLSNSKVATMENQTAEIFIGETVPVVITSLQSGQTGGTFQSVQLDYIDVGVKLNILPRISRDGDITVQVSPEVSTIVGFVGPDSDLPQTATRRATSMVRVKNGQTFYMGGLLKEEERTTIKKVPILGDIPLLGYLFRHYSRDSVQTDLLIEITPTIVED